MARFDLTPEIIDLIVYGMENQERALCFDTETCTLCPLEGREEGEDRYVDLPPWGPVQGYRLMESFVASLRNRVVKERLRRILASREKVFRRFKDALKEFPLVEKRWFAFKDRWMRREVVQWYNALRQSWGLSSLPLEMEDDLEIEGLLEGEFSFFDLKGESLSHSVTPLVDGAWTERFPGGRGMIGVRMKEALSALEGEDRYLVCLTPSDEIAGLCWYKVAGDSLHHLLLLHVFPEFQGLGLEKALWRRWWEGVERRGGTALVELPGKARELEDEVKMAGFQLMSTTYLFIPEEDRSP